MQIILAAAKIMNLSIKPEESKLLSSGERQKRGMKSNDRLKSVPDVSLSSPRFQYEAYSFARDMAQYSAETLANTLGCSQQIAAQNRMRYMEYGLAYKHLKAETLNINDLNYSQGKLWITSFLYGLPRPLVLWYILQQRNTSTCLTGSVSVRKSE